MKTALTLIILVLSSSFWAQNDDGNQNPNSLKGTPFKDRLYTGGNLGLSFGNITTVNIAPIVGYKLNKKFSMGVGAKYLFYRENFPAQGWEYKTSMYGGSVFSRYLITDNIFAHAEYESINREVWEIGAASTSRKWVNMGLIGGGYRSGFFNIMVLYDLVNDRNSPYRAQYLFGPDVPIVIQAGVSIGL